MADWTWDAKGTTATYEEGNTKIVVKGMKADSQPTVNNDGTITLTSTMLDGKAVSITTSKLNRTGEDAVAYRLVLDSSVIGTPTYSWSAPNVAANAKEAGVTVTYACEYTSSYSINGRNIAYSKTPKKTTQNIFTISGVNNQTLAGTTKGTSDQSGKIAALFPNITGTMSEKIAVTPTAYAFTNANMVINTVNKTMLPATDNAHTISIPDSGVDKTATYSYQWSFNSATAAAYKETQNRYFTQDANKLNTIKYTAAKTAAIATVNGISKDFKTKCEDSVLSTNGYATDEAFRTAVLDAANANGNDKVALVAAKAAYDKSLGKKTGTAAETAALNAAKTAYFKDATVMGQVSTEIAKGITMPGTYDSTTKKISTYEGNIVVNNELLDNKNITLAKGTSTDRTRATYALALSSAYQVPDVDYLWSFTNNTGATYKETKEGFFEDGQSNGNLKYTATKTATLATLNGLNANFKTSVEDAQLLDDFFGQTGTTADAKFIAAIQAGASTADTDALVDARAAYTKSLGNKTYADLTTAQQANIIKAARTAYFKDSEVMDEVSDLIAGGLSFVNGGGSHYNDVLTVGAQALGTANLTLNKGKNLGNNATAYTFNLGDDVLNGSTNKTPTIAVGSDSYAWVVAGANAKLQKMTTSAGYTADNKARNPVIKYTKLATSTKADETLVTIGGLKNGIVADGTGSLDDFFTVNSASGIVTLNQSALGTADIKITDNDASKDWTLAFLSSIVSDSNKIYDPEYTADNSGTKTSGDATKTEGLSWDYNKGTAKLVQTLKPGYTMSHDDKTVYYNVGTINAKAPAGTKDITIAQLTGLNTTLTNTTVDDALDYSFVDDSDNADPRITVGAKALDEKKPVTTTGTGNFKLKFNDVANSAGGSVAQSSVTDPALTLPSATAKYSQTVGIGYSIDSTGKKITYNKKATESILAQINGFADYYKTLSGNAKDEVTSSAMGVSSTAAESYDEALKAAYDKYTEQKTAGATDANALKAAQQAYIDTEAIGGISLAGSVFTIYREALGSTNIVLNTKGDYTVDLSGESSIKTDDNDRGAFKWNVNGTNASYQGHHNAYYMVATNGKQITYTREKWDKDTPIKITGLNKNVDPDNDITATTDAITLKYNALSTTPIVVTAKGDYANADLEFGDDVDYQTEKDAKEAKKAGWIINGTTATYQTFTPAYYTIDNNNNKIAYHALAKEGNALITLTGVKSGLTTNADGVVTNNNINLVTTTVGSASTINVVMKQDALDTKNGGKVTLKGTGDYADAKLALYTSQTAGDTDVPKASSGDEFSYSGANVVLKAGDAGYICDGTTITYSDGTNSAPTLATITGLKTGLTSFENIIGLSGTVINIGASALNGKDVSLTTGNYTLALGSDSATADITAATTIAPRYNGNGSNVVFEQSINASSTAPKYSLDTTQKKIKYYTSPNTATLATLTGVKTGLGTGLSSAVSIDTASSTITINEAAFDDNNSTIKTTSKDYNLVLGGMSDVLSGVIPTFKYNGTGKKVELAQAAGLSGYALAPDEKSISYYAKDARGPVLATITGLNSEAVSKETTLTSGVTLDGKKITLKGSVLGTAAVSITDPYSQNYEFVLDEIQYKEDGQTVKDGDTGTVNTNDSVKFDGWIVSGTTATYNDDATKAYYTLNNNKVTYTAPKKGAEGVKVSGLKSGLLPDTDGNISGITLSGKTIMLDNTVLGSSNITVSDSTYTLKLAGASDVAADKVVDASTTSYEWVATPAGAVTLNQVITEGYEVVSNVVQRTAAKTTTVGTLTGYNPNIKTNAEFDAATDVTETNMFSVTAANGAKYTGAKLAAYKAYNKSLYGEETPAQTTIDAAATTVTDAKKTTALTAAKNVYIGTAIADTISGYLTLGSLKDNGAFDEDTPGTVYQINNTAIFGTTDLKLTGSGGFTFNLGSLPTAVSSTKVSAWIVNGTTATLNSNCDNEYYTLSSDSKTITYNPAATTANSKASAVLTGVKSGLKSGQWSNFITPGDSNKYTLTQAVLGTSKLTVSDGSETAATSPATYNLALGEKVTPSNISGNDAYTFGADLALSANGTSATLKQDQTKGYVLNADKNQITYLSADKTATLATINGIDAGLKTTLETAANALTSSDGTTEPTEVTKPTDTSAADYATQLTNYKAYLLKKAAYDAYQEVITADSSATAAALTAAKEAYFNAALKDEISVNNSDGKITLSDKAIGTVSTGTKKVTLSTTEGYKLAAAKEAADATTTPYEWTVTGNNATYNHNQVAGNVTALDGKSITYSATGTTTPLVVITGFNKALNGNADEFVDHVAVKQNTTGSNDNDAKGDIIKLDAIALKDTTTVKISTNNKNYYLYTTENTEEGGNEPGWVIDTKNGVAEYVDKSTKAYYKKDNDAAPQSLTYTAAVKNDGAKTTYTLTGLKKNTRFESSDIALSGTDTKTITLSENTLGSTVTKVELEIADGATEAKLALGKATDGITNLVATETSKPYWSFSGTTATLKETRPAGYEISSDGTTITNIKTAQTATRATVSGIAKLDTIDVSTITETSMTTGYDADSANPHEQAAYAAYTASIEAGGTAAAALTAAQTAYRESKMSGALKVGKTTVGTEEVDAITVGKTALGTTAVSVAAGKDVNNATTSYTFVLSETSAEKVPTTTTAGSDWYISGTKAEYVSCVPAHYTLADNKITYTAQAKEADAVSQIVIDGLKSGATATGNITLDTENNQIKLSKDVLGTGTTKISSTNSTYAAYTLNFATTTDTTLVKASAQTPTWDQGNITKLNISQEAQSYMLALDGKSITYSANAKDNTVATIGGLVAKPKFDAMKAYSEEGGKTISIKGEQVASNAATVDGKDFTFTFDNTYNGTITSETVESTTTYTVTARAKITGQANADKIVANGDGLEIAGGKGDDNITLGTTRNGGDWVTFAAGDGDDVVANFTEKDSIKTAVAAGSISITRNGGQTPTSSSDVVVDFGNGSITLKGYGTKAISFVSNSGAAIDVTGATYTPPATQGTRSLLYDDNYMETTPVLSSITEITADDYSVGNIEGAADLTKLTKEETPIIASSK